MVVNITGSSSKIIHVDPLQDGDMKRRKPDNSVMREILGRELITIEEGIKKILDKGLFELKNMDNDN